MITECYFPAKCRCKGEWDLVVVDDEAEQDRGRVLDRRHRAVPGADRPAAQRHSDLHCADLERVSRRRVPHRPHPPLLRLVQLRPSRQPPGLPPPPPQRLPRQWRPPHRRRPVPVLPVRQHLQVPPLRLLRHLHLILLLYMCIRRRKL